MRRCAIPSDIDLGRWREYGEVWVDSLWIIDGRGGGGWYWGNFVPHIPRQLMMCYTRRGEWVLDPFLGSGTTLVECRRLGRNCVGVELNKDVIKKVQDTTDKEPNPYNIKSIILNGDSRKIDIKRVMKENSIDKFQLLILHPPYHNIIKFSDDPSDLSNARDTSEFMKMFGEVLDNTLAHLEDGGVVGLVMGDKYERGEWVPLGFMCMEEVRRRGCRLKSIVVKNFDETRGKRGRLSLWRYRALAGGFYVFKHEYIFIFVKNA